MRGETATDHRETEWQFEAADIGAVRDWLGDRVERGAVGDSGGLSVGDGKTLLLTDRYLDTEDRRLWRAGYALRVRSRGKSSEATLKSLAEAGGGGVRRRREISEPLSSGEAPEETEGPVGTRLRALAADRRLGELFEVRTRRVAYPLTLSSTAADGGSSESTAAGELATDETEIPVPGAGPVRLYRVEVEVGPGGRESLEPFVSELRETCGLTPAAESKFGAGLMARGIQPPEEPDFGPEEIDPSLTLGETAYAVMRRQLREFLGHEPGVRLGEDPGEVHGMRLAGHRLRAALPEEERRFEPELKHFATVLGEVRDLDGQLESLERCIASSPGEDHGPLEELRGVLRGEHAGARERMLAELDSGRYERLVDTLSRTLRLGPSRRNNPSDEPVVEAAPELVRHAYRRVRKTGDRICPESPAGDYHALRKRCKRLLYLVEPLEEVYGDPARKLVKRIKPLQDVLGGLQDAEAARERLRRIAFEAGESGEGTPELSRAAVFAAGGVAARRTLEAEELRRDFPAAYSGIKGKPRKRLEKAMKKARKEHEEHEEHEEREEREEGSGPDGG